MPNKWIKINGQSRKNFIKIDYINNFFEEDEIGAISRISLYIYPDGFYQLMVEDRESKLINLDRRFVTDLSWLNFWGSDFYLCKSPKTNDREMLEDLIHNINAVEDISEIELDLCLNINPDLSSEDVFEYVVQLTQIKPFNFVLNTIKELAINDKYKNVAMLLAKKYENHGMFEEAWEIYDASLTNDEEDDLNNLILMCNSDIDIIDFIKTNHYEYIAMHLGKYYEKIGLFENSWEIYKNILPEDSIKLLEEANRLKYIMICNEPLFINEDEKKSFDRLINKLDDLSKMYILSPTSVADLDQADTIISDDDDENDLKAQNLFL